VSEAARSTQARIVVVIPAFNEARSIGKVVEDIPPGLVQEVVVVNNGSNDETERNATAAGAMVVREARRGYGWACLRGIDFARSLHPDIIVFLDGDYSDHPEEMTDIVAPILEDRADLVIGSRVLGTRERGAMLPQAVIGNRVACALMRLIWGARYTDLGPFRAVRASTLASMKMEDKTYGWTIEMQIKALRLGLRVEEVPVSYRKRVGVSKVTGTVSGTLKASYRILYTIARYALKTA
jgi:glycosyltransferase involved in cell wall biosynthesis